MLNFIKVLMLLMKILPELLKFFEEIRVDDQEVKTVQSVLDQLMSRNGRMEVKHE